MKPLRVALPLGIGDTHWACTKFRGLSEYHGGRPIEAHISSSRDHATVNYLRLLPTVSKAIQNTNAPYDIEHDLPHYRDPKWATLQGSAGWRGFDYVLVPNGHLERGLPLSSYLPEIPTDHAYPLDIPAADVAHAHSLAAPGSVLLYPSGIGPNDGFHKNTWAREHWAAVVRLLNAHGITPVLVGAKTPGDMGYRKRLDYVLDGLRYVDAIGQTTTAQIMAMIGDAGAWCGLNSGLGIVSAMLGTPTVMLWADKRYPIPGQTTAFDPRMQTSWLTKEQQKTYRTFSYGSLILTPENVVKTILAVVQLEKAA